MSKKLAVVTSDNHLEKHAWAGRPELSGDSYYSFSQACDYAEDNNVAMILAGDVFTNAYPDPETVAFAVGQLTGLCNQGLQVLYTQGQHEYHAHPWLRLVRGGFHLHCRSVILGDDLGNPEFYGLDFTRAGALREELSKVPEDTDVLVAHQVWLERMGEKANPEGSFADISRVKKMVITGDFHAHRSDVFKGKEGQDLVVLSPGSQCLQTVDEDPDKYFFVLYDDLTFESVKLKTRARLWKTFRNPSSFSDELARLREEAAPQEGVPEGIARPIVVAEFSEEIPGAADRLRSAMKGRAHLFERVIEVQREKGKAVKGGLSMAERLAKDYRKDEDVYLTAARLLFARDPKAELKHVIAEYLKEEGDGWEDHPEGQKGEP